MTKLVANPVVPVKSIPIEVAIRLERNRIFDIEFETGEKPDDSTLQSMYHAQSLGISCWHDPDF